MRARKKPKLGRPAGANRAEETRPKIVAAAIQCFAERGYGGTSNQQIAQQADITTGTLYHYFDSKADLYIAALQEVIDQVLAEYRAAAEKHADASYTVQIAQGIEQVICLAKSRPGIMQFAAQASIEIQRSKELAPRLKGQQDEFTPFFTELLHKARSRGEIAMDADIESVAMALTACFIGMAQVYPGLGNAEFSRVLRSFEAIMKGEVHT